MRGSEMRLYAEISPGELFDKITILEIKNEQISDPKKLVNVKKECQILTATRDKNIVMSDELSGLLSDLKSVNKTLWVIEDDIRDCERNKNFGPKFIELARGVYIENDKRAMIKNKINQSLNSNLFEEKSYKAY